MNRNHDRIQGRLPRWVRPASYDLALRIDPREERFSGEVVIQAYLDRPGNAICLHARNLDIQRADAELPDGTRLAARVGPAQGPGAEPDYGEIQLDFERALPIGWVRLVFRFSAPFDPQLSGLYRVRDGENWYAVTQFEAADARKCFPSFDEPGFKVPFRVSLSVPTGMVAASNTPEESVTPDGAFTTVRFQQTEPLPTYLLAFVVGPFDVVPYEGASKVPIRALAARGKGALTATGLEFTAGLLPVLERYFGSPYPYAKLDVVAVPDFGAGAMENAGLITFREELLLADPKSTPKSRRRTIAEVVAHEVAHHWFGNLVTMAWWDDLWLNEAFATWMAAKAVDTWRPEYEQVLEMLQGRSRVMATDSLSAARKVRQEVVSVGDAEQAFDDLTYHKGAAVLGMLERWVGEERFRAGVRRYLDAHRWGNATAQDLFAALDAESGQDVSGVAKSFLDKPGVPLVEVLRADGQLRVRQSSYELLGVTVPGAAERRWKIPVRVRGLQWTVLDGEEASVPGTASFLHPNDGEWSYYRWSFAPAELRRLTQHARELDVRGRIGVLENAWAMVAAGTQQPDLYLEVLLALREIAERPIVEMGLAGAARVFDLWEEQARTPAYRRLVGLLFGGHFSRLGLDPRDSDKEDEAILRPQLVRALGYLGREKDVLDAAGERARRYLQDPSSVSGDLAPVCVALAAHEGTVGFSELAALLGRARAPDQRMSALAGLGMLPAGEPIRAALELTLSPAVRAQDFNAIFRGALERTATRAQAFQWFEQNYDAVRKRQPEFTFVHMGGILGVFRAEAERDSARRFFDAHAIKGGERAVQQGYERASHAIALRKNGAAAVAGFLERMGPA